MSFNATTLHGTPAFSAGEFSNALSGGVLTNASVDSFLGGADNATLNTTGTIELWLKNTNVSNNWVAIGREKHYWIGSNSSTGNVQARYGAGTTGPSVPETVLTGAVNICDGAWHHVALVFVAGAGSLYVDGARVATDSNVRTAGTSTGGFCLGGWSSSTSNDWPGQIDEVRISNNARYTGTTYTVPSAEFISDANTVALYHLNSDGTDSASSVAPPTIGTISISSSGGTDTITYPAPTAGANAVGGVSLYVGTSSGGESSTAFATNLGTGGGTFTHASPTSGQFFYFVKAFDAGTPTTYSSASNEVSSGIAPSTTTILPNNAGIKYSPYTWDVTSARALTNAGGYFRVILTGSPSSIALTFDVSSLASPASKIAYRIDRRGGWVVTNIAATVNVPIPTDVPEWTKHFLEVAFIASTENANRWASPYATAAKLTGIVLGGSGGGASAPVERTLKGLVFGDSITEGISTIGLAAGDTSTKSDYTVSWASMLGECLGAEVGAVGFGRQGITVTGNGSVPTLPNTYNLIAAGLTRSFTPTPDFIAINMGTNDSALGTSSSAFQSGYVSLLNSILAATPSTTLIFIMLPFHGDYGLAAFQAIAAACSTPSRVVVVDTTGWLAPADSNGTVHPFGHVDISTLGPLTAAAIRTGLNRGSIFLNSAGTAKAVGPKRN